jgi:hypothetical protein
MRERREHYIAAGYSKEKSVALAFTDDVRASNDEFLKRPVINDQPPPEREVVLVISASEYDQLLTSSLEKVHGFIFDRSVSIDGPNLKSAFLVSLRGLLARMLKENQNIKHFEPCVALFSSEGTIEELRSVYGALKDLCSDAGKDVKIEFDIVQDRQELRIFLKSQLYKIAHGDIKTQFATLSR